MINDKWQMKNRHGGFILTVFLNSGWAPLNDSAALFIAKL